MKISEFGRKLNVIQNHFTIARIRPLKPDTVVVLVYDTDVAFTDVLRENLIFLNKQKNIKEVLCIPQVMNLEDELKYACRIKNIGELTHSGTKKDYKRDLRNCSNLGARLHDCGFEMTKLWSRQPQNAFSEFGNAAEKIRL